MKQYKAESIEQSLNTIVALADGTNPVTCLALGEDSIFNTPEVIRSLYFAKSVLENLLENNGFIGYSFGNDTSPFPASARTTRVTRKKKLHEFPMECLKAFKPVGKRSLTKVVGSINEPIINNPDIMRVSVKQVSGWLICEGFLKEEEIPELGKTVKVATDKGNSIGITSELTTYELRHQKYMLTLYDVNAQKFIADNLAKIINGEALGSSQASDAPDCQE